MNHEIFKKYIPERHAFSVQGNLAVYEISAAELLEHCRQRYTTEKLPLKLIAATDERTQHGVLKVFYIFGVPKENIFLAPFITVPAGGSFPSVVSAVHEASWYEQYIFTFFGIKPEGHPNLQPILLHANWPKDKLPLLKDTPWNLEVPYEGGALPDDRGVTSHFQKIEGEGIYELPVGPIHAGIIEPGHFRFSLAGEEVLSLQAKLGYKHKGIEKLFENLPLEKTVRLAEHVSGDSSFNHSLAFCQALESLAGVNVPERALFLRTVYAELERLANHFNDIGFIMMDTAYTFGGAQGARLREKVMQWHERLTGSRFLRGVNTVGGVTKDINAAEVTALSQDMLALKKDFAEVMEIAENSHIMIDRLKGAGLLDAKVAEDHGAVGMAAKGCGKAIDARLDFPYAAYGQIFSQIMIYKTRDVYARFVVRVKEVFESFEMIRKALEQMPEGDIVAGGLTGTAGGAVQLPANAYAASITEGWRGDIVYFVATDAEGALNRVAVRDPSILNWGAIVYAVQGNVVPDFPLINKSFNLSYSGNDL